LNYDLTLLSLSKGEGRYTPHVFRYFLKMIMNLFV
jgi:hypothetical protein